MIKLLERLVGYREPVIIVAEPTPDFSKEMVIIEIPERDDEEDNELPKK